jgi:NAD(P)-dependent dehydrogenase (short-subunit alcohol dehydrogenase family)
MISSAQKTVIVTGASGGIGAAIASRFSGDGWRVFGTMRRPDPIIHGPDALALDVSSDDSVANAVAEVMARTGRIDAIINNAGVDMLGAIEETTIGEAHELFETNFFGVHRLTQAVLPVMRAQKSGHIVTIGSIAGFLPTPFNGFYSASKHALEGYCETLDYEVRRFGIRTVLIEPGFIKTNLRAKKVTTEQNLEPYRSVRDRAGLGFDQGVDRGIDPTHVARIVANAVNAADPKFRQRVGKDARFLNLAYHYLPNAMFRRGMAKQFGSG